MNELLLPAVALAAVVGAGIGDLVSEEVRARLDRVPQMVTRLAVRRLPFELRAELADEWLAELHEVLRGADALPVTRLIVGFRFALGLLRASRTVGRELQDRQQPALHDRGEHFLTPRQLPEHPRGLIGRGDELASIVGDTRHTLTAISGKAGIGKTVLAILAAHSLAVNFPDGQLYINLRTSGPSQPVTAEQALRRFLMALGSNEATLPSDATTCQKLYWAMTANKSMLIVLDDAATAAHVRPLLPQTDTCRVLITSRAPLTDLVAREGACRLDLGALSNPDAANLWRSLTEGSREDADEEVAELVETCAHLPLAVCLAAGHARSRPHMLLADLVRAIRSEATPWSHLVARADGRLTEAIHTALDSTYEALPPPAKQMLRLLGQRPCREIDVQEAAALAGIDVHQAAHLLQTLAARSILEAVSSSGNYRIHELVHRYAASLPEADE